MTEGTALLDAIAACAFAVTDDDTDGMIAFVSGAYITTATTDGTSVHYGEAHAAPWGPNGLYDANAAEVYDAARHVLRRGYNGGADPVEVEHVARRYGRDDALAAIDAAGSHDVEPDLSGQWVDGRSVRDVMAALGLDIYSAPDWVADTIADEYETAFYAALETPSAIGGVA